MNTTQIILLLLVSVVTGLTFQGQKSTRDKLKSEILDLASKVERGLTETADERKQMLTLFEKLEKLNPTKETLSSPLLSAVWNFKYTTSDTILGRGTGNERVGNIFQKIDATNLRAQNSEIVHYFKLFNIPRKVTANLKPISKTKVAVQFDQFSIGPLKIKAPASNKGQVDITYLDNDMRLSCGDKGNYFVLIREAPLSEKL